MSQNRNFDLRGVDGLDEIPMQRAKPGLIAGIAGGVVLVIGTIVWASSSGGDAETEKRASELKAKAEAVSKQSSGLSAKEQQEHLKMTQRALANFESQQNPERGAKPAAQAEAAPVRRTAPANRVTRTSAPRAAPAPRRAPAPAPQNKAKAKKQLDSLDAIGASITDALE